MHDKKSVVVFEVVKEELKDVYQITKFQKLSMEMIIQASSIEKPVVTCIDQKLNNLFRVRDDIYKQIVSEICNGSPDCP